MSERGAYISETWWPDEADIGFAADLGFGVPAIELMAETFRDYWLGAAGQNARKRSWPATWRNWCRKEAEKRGKQAGNRSAAVDRRHSVVAGMVTSFRGGSGQPTLWESADGKKRGH